MDRVEGAGRKWVEERKSRIRERRGMGERRLGRRKEKRGWRKEEEIRNKSKKVGEKRRSPFGYILLSSISEGLFCLEVCLLAKFCISGELSIG